MMGDGRHLKLLLLQRTVVKSQQNIFRWCWTFHMTIKMCLHYTIENAKTIPKIKMIIISSIVRFVEWEKIWIATEFLIGNDVLCLYA